MKTEQFTARINERISKALKIHPSANVEVLRFIYEFTEQRDTNCNFDEDVIVTKFSTSYCYYFALMLKDAFMGELMWIKGTDHIVFHDYQSAMCYDIKGLYIPAIDANGVGEPVPLDMLGGSLECFRHRGYDEALGNHIMDYCRATGITQEALTEKVCSSFPRERRVFEEPNKGDLFDLWDEWYENNINNIDNLCLHVLKEGAVCIKFSPDEQLFDELAEQITELPLCQSQVWIDRHPKATGASSNCAMLYYCELFDKYFRFSVTRWTDVHYEVCVHLEELRPQKEHLQQLQQF